MQQRLVERKQLDAAGIAAMEERVRHTIEEAAAFAAASPFPAASEVATEVYA